MNTPTQTLKREAFQEKVNNSVNPSSGHILMRHWLAMHPSERLATIMSFTQCQMSWQAAIVNNPSAAMGDFASRFVRFK